MKQKYALIEKDFLGGTSIKYYYCNERTIKRIIFKRYLELKRVSIKSSDEFKRVSRTIKKRVRVKDDYPIFTKKRKKLKSANINKTYNVLIKRGWDMLITLSYEKLDSKSSYIAYENIEYGFGMHHNLGNGSRYAVKKTLKREFLRFKKNLKDDIEFQVIKDSKLLYLLEYWYRCNYESDEWDTQSKIFKAKKIKFKKVAK